MRRAIAAVLPLIVTAGIACKKPAPSPTPLPTPAITLPPATQPPVVGVGAVTLGNAIGPDKRVTAPSEAFRPKDTIYAAVETGGVGHAKLRALWTFVRGAQTAKVDETTIEADLTGPAVHEFHVSKPSGWPVGTYRVEIFLNDSPTPAATRTFTVA